MVKYRHKGKAMRKSDSLLTANGETVRTSVSIPVNDYGELQRLAVQKKVSIAWVIRDAVDKYLTMEQPLLRRTPVSE